MEVPVIKTEDTESFKICFLCLENKEIKNFSLQGLFLYLKITPQENLAAHSLSASPATEEYNENEVNLCKSCSNISHKLTSLFTQLEKVQLEINYYLEETHKRISESSRPVPEELDILRKEVLNKCKTMQFGRHAKIKLASSTDEPKDAVFIKEETIILEETEDHNFIDEGTEEYSVSKSEEILNENDSESSLDSPTQRPKSKRTFNHSQSIPRQKLQKNLEGRFDCPACDKTFKSRQATRYHYQSVHLQKQFKCDICNIAVFSRPNVLSHHKKTCKATLEKRLERRKKRERLPFICCTCEKTFPSQNLLNKHQRFVHLKERRFTCEHCQKTFQLSTGLKNHILAVHQTTERFPCRFCSKSYSYKSNTLQHERICSKRLP